MTAIFERQVSIVFGTANSKIIYRIATALANLFKEAPLYKTRQLRHVNQFLATDLINTIEHQHMKNVCPQQIYITQVGGKHLLYIRQQKHNIYAEYRQSAAAGPAALGPDRPANASDYFVHVLYLTG